MKTSKPEITPARKNCTRQVARFVLLTFVLGACGAWATTPVISGMADNQPLNDDQTILPFLTLQVADPDNEAMDVTVTIQNGANRGDFSFLSSLAWVRTPVGNDIVYTQSFPAQANIGAVVTPAIQGLVFVPRKDAIAHDTTELTVFAVQVFDGTDTVVNPSPISTLTYSVNDPPQAIPQSLSFPEDNDRFITLMAIDFDVADTLTYSIKSAPTYGTLVGFDANAGTVTYHPNQDYNGVDALTFQVTDGDLVSDAVISIEVTPVNDPPQVADQVFSVEEQSPNGFPVGTVIAFDVDNTALTYAVVGGTGIDVFELDASAEIRVKDSNQLDFETGPHMYTLVVTVTDDYLIPASSTAVMTINVTDVNRPPIISAIDDLTIAQGQTAGPIMFVIGDDETPAAELTLSKASSDETLVPLSGIVFGGADTIRTVAVTPVADQTGSAVITVTVSDGQNGTSEDFTLTVSAGNEAPVADAQSITTDEDTAVSITLTGSDADGDPLTFLPTSNPLHGTLSGTPPTLVYTPAANYHGPDSFTFVANDEQADSPAATVSITVNPVNDSPTANDLAVTIEEDTAVAVGLTGGDVDGDALTFSVVTGPSHGTLSGTAPDLTYTPDADYNGPDSFTYKANDGQADSPEATVSITVNPVNDAPTANDLAVTTDEDTAVAVGLTGGDVDGDALTFSVVAGPSHGTLSGTAPNLTYTPDVNYNGPDSFTYTANDGSLESAVATVTITVNPVNDAPVANNQSVTTPEDTPVAITLTGSDVEGDALTFAVVNPPTHGILSGTPPAVTYTPNAGYSGTDAFTFKVNDGNLDSAEATVTIEIGAVNDAPVADDQSVTTDEDTPVAIVLTGTDPEGDALTFGVVDGPAHGSLGGSAPNLTYTPNLNYNGPDSFTFKVNDGQEDSAPATVSITVNPVNDAPMANDLAVTTDEDMAVAVVLSGMDVDGDSLAFAVVDGPAHGSLGGAAPNLTYTPELNFNGTDTFTYKANDGTADSGVATVTITVNSVNDAPVADTQNVTTDEDTPVAITLSGSDVDGDALTFAVIGNPAHGSLSGTPPDLTYTPNANFNGADSFTFNASDGIAASPLATVMITVNPVNDPPTANDLAVSTDEDTPVAITLTGSDVDGDALTLAVVTGPASGTLGGTPPDLTYTPNPGFIGTDTFTFKANDGTVDSAEATVTITVNEVAPTPFVYRHLPPGGYEPGQPLTVTLEAMPEPSVLSWSTMDQPPMGWAISDISDGGTFDPVSSTVNFGPFTDPTPRTLSYVATPPDGEEGVKTFTGTAEADGETSPILGDSQLGRGTLLHPADLQDPTFSLSEAEVMAYVAAWRAGETWPVPPNPIPVDYVTRGGALWKGGECYRFDDQFTSPMCWVSCDATPPPPPGDDDEDDSDEGELGDSPMFLDSPPLHSSEAVRHMPTHYVPGQTLPVAIKAKPARKSFNFAVEEVIPPGWTVANVSDNGVVDEVNGLIKWGPFYDDLRRSVSYEITAPATATDDTVAFSGVISCDGYSEPMVGVTETRRSWKLKPNKPHTPGWFKFEFKCDPGVSYVVEASDDLVHWSTLSTLQTPDGNGEYSEPNDSKVKAKFYRVRKAQ